MNTALKSLTVDLCDEFGGELCAAIRSGLAKNSTLEELSLHDMVLSDDDGAVSAHNALSFIRTNSTLQSLRFVFLRDQKQSHISAFRLGALKMLENTVLQRLTIHADCLFKFDELCALISALQLNTTLKTLGLLFPCLEDMGNQTYTRKSLYLSDDEVNQLVSILRKNYGLQRLRLPWANDRTIKAILRLNRAGRRYLIEDGSSISKGVEVLSAVNKHINCVFLHLLENPGLCNRRAVDEESVTGCLSRLIISSSGKGE
jgi:hypothetical protein